MWPALRIEAPPLEISPELRWVLTRAFAPIETQVPQLPDSVAVFRLAEQLDLVTRIATRSADAIGNELGVNAARSFAFQRLEALALERELQQVASEVITLALALQLPVILLKHAALRATDKVREGERRARDVDVLVPRGRAPELQQALLGAGFRAPLPSLVSHHLPTLVRGPGEVVEVHESLWGVRIPGVGAPGVDTGAEELICAGLTYPLARGGLVPAPEVLAAHFIVHGLVQHRTSPDGYPSMRAITDLVVLTESELAVTASCSKYVSKELADVPVDAAFRLARALTLGTDIAMLARQVPELRLLSHVLAASTDEDYRRALRFERIGELLASRELTHTLASVFRRRGSSAHPEGARAELAREFARAARSYAKLLIFPRRR